MGSMRRKLRDNTGAMALFALAGFLLAAAVSFAIVTAAVNNANRVKGQQEEQRAYLAVTSAATLLRESLAGKSVTITQELDLSMDETKREYSGDDSALARAFADALLAAHLDGSTFTDEQLTLNVTDDLKMKVSTSYDGWRLSMKIEPMAEKYKGIAPPMTLTFDNARVNCVETPVYELVEDYETIVLPDGSATTILYSYYELKYYIRVTTVGFPEHDVRVEAKR
ncbi:MAG: hypothetical protein IJU66_09540 [Oscillospiraceae bacterium]|nr:hypothetical protein [Oscillospiraceae bacterium]